MKQREALEMAPRSLHSVTRQMDIMGNINKVAVEEMDLNDH